MITRDAAGKEILELHIWVAFVFLPENGAVIIIKTAPTKKELEAWWGETKEHIYESDVRYTIASVREMR